MTAASACPIALSQPASRRSLQAQVRWGSRLVTVGGDAPVRVQSMTNTDTVDVIGTAIQVKELALAGSELVRITVNTEDAARAVPHIREQLDRMGVDVPLVGDFHYNGHRLLSDFPDCAENGRHVTIRRPIEPAAMRPSGARPLRCRLWARQRTAGRTNRRARDRNRYR